MPVTIGGSGPITGVTSINTTVTDTELGYLDGVSSALQTQINAKAATTAVGLTYIGSYSITGQTTLNIDSVFSSTYDEYRIVGGFTGTSGGLTVTLRDNGVNNGTADFRSNGIYSAYNSTASAFGATGQTYLLNLTIGSELLAFSFDLLAPAVSNSSTLAVGHWVRQSEAGSWQGRNANNASFEGIQFSGSANLSGTVRIYGYQKG